MDRAEAARQLKELIRRRPNAVQELMACAKTAVKPQLVQLICAFDGSPEDLSKIHNIIDAKEPHEMNSFVLQGRGYHSALSASMWTSGVTEKALKKVTWRLLQAGATCQVHPFEFNALKSPLYIAIMDNNSPALTEAILARGVDVHRTFYTSGARRPICRPILCYALEQRNRQWAAQLLAKHGADVNAVHNFDEGEHTAITYAYLKYPGSSRTCQTMLTYADKYNNDHMTIAIGNRYPPLVRALSRQGFRITKQNLLDAAEVRRRTENRIAFVEEALDRSQPVTTNLLMALRMHKCIKTCFERQRYLMIWVLKRLSNTSDSLLARVLAYGKESKDGPGIFAFTIAKYLLEDLEGAELVLPAVQS